MIAYPSLKTALYGVCVSSPFFRANSFRGLDTPKSGLFEEALIR